MGLAVGVATIVTGCGVGAAHAASVPITRRSDNTTRLALERKRDIGTVLLA